MAISLETIVTGMNGGPEAIQQNFNKVKAELERMNGSVTVIPKEQFTALNATNVDTTHCSGYVFKFNNFAILSLHAYIGVNMKGWTSRDVVSIPKAYFSGFTKFDQFDGIRRFGGDGPGQFDVSFKVDTGILNFQTRGNDWPNLATSLDLSGVLYN